MTPRDEAKARERLLADCRRPSFARLARYTKEISDGSGEMVTRASVKFVEAALARWGNVRTQNIITNDTDKSRTVRVVITDLESGAEYSKEILLEKVVERQKARLRETILGTRMTPSGQVLLLPATEDDLAAKEAELASIVVRQLGLRILPADLVAECMDQVIATLAACAPDPALPSPHQDKPPEQSPQESRSSALVGLLKKRRADAQASRKKPVSGRQDKKRRPKK